MLLKAAAQLRRTGRLNHSGQTFFDELLFAIVGVAKLHLEKFAEGSNFSDHIGLLFQVMQCCFRWCAPFLASSQTRPIDATMQEPMTFAARCIFHRVFSVVFSVVSSVS